MRVTVVFRVSLFLHWCRNVQGLHSFPTRRSSDLFRPPRSAPRSAWRGRPGAVPSPPLARTRRSAPRGASTERSEEHMSELQSRPHLVCRLLLEKKNCTGSGIAGMVWIAGYGGLVV